MEREQTESKAVGAARSQRQMDGRRVIRHGMILVVYSRIRDQQKQEQLQPNRVSRIYQGGQPKDEGPSAWSPSIYHGRSCVNIFLWNQNQPPADNNTKVGICKKGKRTREGEKKRTEKQDPGLPLSGLPFSTVVQK